MNVYKRNALNSGVFVLVIKGISVDFKNCTKKVVFPDPGATYICMYKIIQIIGDKVSGVRFNGHHYSPALKKVGYARLALSLSGSEVL